ncbi:MAG: sigma-70 family RNA polymerase sigma factor [Bacilli bacterium]|nr:sigma-70 family RNA polymerase sigma factor [Bacilli bacterium]
MARLEKAMKNLKKGNMKAFDVIYEETKKIVFFTIYDILKDYSLSDDIMQDAYIMVVNKIQQYQDDSNPRNWIITIAKNLALNEYNKHKKDILVDYSENEQLAGKSYDKDVDTPLLNLAKKVLSEDEYQILTLIIVDSFKRREVASMLNMPIGTVTWKYNEAIRKIKQAYERMVVQNER